MDAPQAATHAQRDDCLPITPITALNSAFAVVGMDLHHQRHGKLNDGAAHWTNGFKRLKSLKYTLRHCKNNESSTVTAVDY
jgi:hypothetical protein